MAEPKNIVITGVSRGLGRALVEGFVKLGHRVAGCARSKEEIGVLIKEHRGHSFQVVDVTDEGAVAKWAKRLHDRWGVADLLINNAGIINRGNPLWKVSSEEMDRVVDVNIKGVANVIRLFLPSMIARGSGVVVNMSSGWGRSVSPEVAPYCATKWAIEGMTRAMAMELPSGLAAVPVNPGIIDTKMLRTCFGDHAGDYQTPREWAEEAVTFLLELGPEDNGKPVQI